MIYVVMNIKLLRICKEILSKLKVTEPRPSLILQESFVNDLNYKLSNKGIKVIS